MFLISKGLYSLLDIEYTMRKILPKYAHFWIDQWRPWSKSTCTVCTNGTSTDWVRSTGIIASIKAFWEERPELHVWDYLQDQLRSDISQSSDCDHSYTDRGVFTDSSLDRKVTTLHHRPARHETNLCTAGYIYLTLNISCTQEPALCWLLSAPPN